MCHYRGQQAASSVWIEEQRVAALQGVEQASVAQLGLHNAALAWYERGQLLFSQARESLQVKEACVEVQER